jgi:hypothetical protein
MIRGTGKETKLGIQVYGKQNKENVEDYLILWMLLQDALQTGIHESRVRSRVCKGGGMEALRI